MEAHPRLFLLGASHHTAPIAVRERFAIAPGKTAEFHHALRHLPGIRECLVLGTCNRLEIYAVGDGPAAETAVESFLCAFQSFPASEFENHRFILRGPDAITHLVEVASGIDSQIVGETEIFGQVKSAYSTAASLGTTATILNRVFQKAFQAAKYVRANTPIGEGQISVATVAVELAEKIFGDLRDCRVLVLGTGDVGEKTSKALRGRGVAAMTVLSRTLERATALAAALQAESGTMDAVAAHLPAHDIVVGSTIANQPVVGVPMLQAALRRRDVRPLFLVDLGIPRNFDPAAGEVDSVFLYDLDDLARIADENIAARRASVDHCRRLAQDKAARIWDAIHPHLEAGAVALGPDRLSPDEQATG